MLIHDLATIAGFVLVALGLSDLLNTLVTMTGEGGRWWPSRIVGNAAFVVVRAVASRLDEDNRWRERLLAAFGPVLLLIMMIVWIAVQVVGFALVWWGTEGVSGLVSFGDALYYSGVVFFTVGFGDMLPHEVLPRMGVLVQAGLGVVTTALVIGYLPSLYGAYSQREQKLQTLDDGTGERITPTSLVIAWGRDGDISRVNAQLAEWEEWVSALHETHTTLPMLRLFRSHDRRQNWVTALGLLADAAVHAQVIDGGTGKTESYWLLRRIVGCSTR